jgi:hypothetical protein
MPLPSAGRSGSVKRLAALGGLLALGLLLAAPVAGATTHHAAKQHHKTKPKAATTKLATSCTVVTRAQAGAALGQSVTAGVLGHATVEGGLACVYYGPNAPSKADADVPVPDSVRVVLVTGSDALKWFDDYKGKVAAQPISGLGNQAYYDGDASVSVLVGSEYLRVAVIGATGVSEAAEEQLARDALPKM